MKIKVPEIEIRYLDYRKLTPFQGNLKDLYEKNFNRLKKSLEEKGGFVPMFVWIQNEGKQGQTYWISRRTSTATGSPERKGYV